jgi:hypothetical protein
LVEEGSKNGDGLAVRELGKLQAMKKMESNLGRR